MADEIQALDDPGQVVYAVVLGSGVTVWSVSAGAFVTVVPGGRPNYAVAMPESSLGGLYVGDFPAAIPAGIYSVIAYRQLGVDPAEDDLPIAQQGDFGWSGSVLTLPTPGPDPAFERGFNATVAVYVDDNASGQARSSRGVVQPVWRLVSGFGAVRCMLDPTGTRTVETEYGPRVYATAVVLFSGRLAVDARHKLVVASPAPGAVAEWFVEGAGVDEAGSGHHTTVRCIDVKL
jgi:hypothetical protein